MDFVVLFKPEKRVELGKEFGRQVNQGTEAEVKKMCILNCKTNSFITAEYLTDLFPNTARKGESLSPSFRIQRDRQSGESAVVDLN